ncbi:MAG: hypothetical protein KDK39_01405 [Leptospiraceae bacterium]|nr:hypothetical protein [Leptospiraceae bacterium]
MNSLLSSNRFRAWAYPLSGMAVALLVGSRIWVAEDAYITFRSVLNFFDGFGLVFNPGEHIEASTHPLWTIILILVHSCGVPLHQAAIGIGLAASLLTLSILLNRDHQSGLVLPWTALLLFTNSGIRDFSTAGMEYSLVIAMLALLLLALERRRLSDHPFAFASLNGLLYLARPEMGLLALWYSLMLLLELLAAVSAARPTGSLNGGRVSAAWRLWQLILLSLQRRQTWAVIGLWMLGLLAAAGPWHVFRWLYYNEIFPNTYYAKAGLSSYYSQGWRYLVYTVLWSPGWMLAGVMILLALLWRPVRRHLDGPHLRSILRELGAVALLTFYVVRVGGDFMSFRFLLAELAMTIIIWTRILPAWKLWLQEQFDRPESTGLHRALAHLQGTWAVVVLVVVGFLVLWLWPVPYYQGYVADERRTFTRHGQITVPQLLVGSQHEWGREGERFRALSNCLDLPSLRITNSITQAHCMPDGYGLGYFGVAAGPRVWILDEQALPNRSVADLPVLWRWRPGHEHYVDLGFVLDQRVLFCSSGEPEYDAIMQTQYGTIVSWDPAVLASLPQIQRRLQLLQQYQRRNPSPVIARLEQIWQIRLDELAARSAGWQQDSLARSRQLCWQAINN